MGLKSEKGGTAKTGRVGRSFGRVGGRGRLVYIIYYRYLEGFLLLLLFLLVLFFFGKAKKKKYIIYM